MHFRQLLGAYGWFTSAYERRNERPSTAQRESIAADVYSFPMPSSSEPPRLATKRDEIRECLKQQLRRPRDFYRERRRKCARKSDERPSLGDRFFELPVELQLTIVYNLPFADLLSLRRTSKRFFRLTFDNEIAITNYHIKNNVAGYLTHFYPPPSDHPPTLPYLIDLAYKWQICHSLSYTLASHVIKRLMPPSVPNHLRKETHRILTKGCEPLMMIIHHFFECYRNSRLDRVDAEGPEALRSSVDTDASTEAHGLTERNIELQTDLLGRYDSDSLLKAAKLYLILLDMCYTRMIPKSWVRCKIWGRAYHRWLPDAVSSVLLLGGIDEMWQFYKIRGVRKRRRALENFVALLKQSRREPAQAEQVGSSSAHVSINATPEQTQAWINRLAKIQVDSLTDLWIPAAQERLLDQLLIEDVSEISPTGFIADLLATHDDEEDDDVEDDSDEYQTTDTTVDSV